MGLRAQADRGVQQARWLWQVVDVESLAGDVLVRRVVGHGRGETASK
jgi:hypothetical protein